jgi:hypothetical protein
LTSLVKKIDAATAQHKDAHMGSFVVFCGDEKKFEAQAKELASRDHISHTILTVFDGAAGPSAYHLAKDAEVTVLLYSKRTVKASYGFRANEFTEADADQIIHDLAKILPESKDSSGAK